VQPVTAARRRVGGLVRATGPSYKCVHAGYRTEPDPTKKIGFKVCADPVATLWQALVELDPTFDPNGDEIVAHIRRNVRRDHFEWVMLDRVQPD
jgi:hypothetical protein